MRQSITITLLIISLAINLSCDIMLPPSEKSIDEKSWNKDNSRIELQNETHHREDSSPEPIGYSDSGQSKEEECLTDVSVPLVSPPLHVESEKTEIKANGKDKTLITMYIRSFIECEGKMSLPGLEAYISTSMGKMLDKKTGKPLNSYVNEKKAYKVIFDKEGYTAILTSGKEVGTAIITVEINSRGIEELTQLRVKFVSP